MMFQLYYTGANLLNLHQSDNKYILNQKDTSKHLLGCKVQQSPI